MSLRPSDPSPPAIGTRRRGGPASISRWVEGLAAEMATPATVVHTNMAVLEEHVERFRRTLTRLEDLVFDDPGRRAALRELLANEGVPDALVDTFQIVAENQAGLSRLTKTVRELTGLVRLDPQRFQLVHVNDLVEVASARIVGRLADGAVLQHELGRVPPIVADRYRLLRVIGALLDNALHALRALPDVADGTAILVRTHADDRSVAVSVHDRGAGIPPHALDRVFDPFFTTRAQARGLGLTIAAQVARLHGGDVWVESGAEVGTEARLILPRETGLRLPERA